MIARWLGTVFVMLRSSSVALTVHFFGNVVYALQIQFSGRKLATEGRGWKVLHYVDVQAVITIYLLRTIC